MANIRKHHHVYFIVVIAFFVCLIAVQLFKDTRHEHSPLFRSQILDTTPKKASPISYNATDDADTQLPDVRDDLFINKEFEIYNMAAEECEAEFSELFSEIDRAALHRKSIGHVNASEIDLQWAGDGGVRAMIYKQKLYILESRIGFGYYPPRVMSILNQIDRAILASPGPLPDIEFSFVVKDIPDEEHAHHTVWALTRQTDDQETWLMPDFGYWSWPLDLVGAYEQIRMEIHQNRKDWRDKVPKALWRGALKTNKIRASMFEATRGKKWADVEEVRWKNRLQIAGSSAPFAMPMVDHCAYQFLIHTEGLSYSGRGKYLFNCGSVVITHKSKWIEPHHNVMVKSGPTQNVVEVERDFSDLEEKMEELLQDPERARKIAINGESRFRNRYLTPAAQSCYWRRLISTWAGVSFRPHPWEIVDGKWRLRGIPFETFAQVQR